MKPIDQFRRTPLRRYDLPPQKARWEEQKRDDSGPRFSKHYFEIPDLGGKIALRRSARAFVCAVLLIVCCRGSAPLGEVPDAGSRFREWAAKENEKTVESLPGPTPEPGSELAEKLSALEQQEEETPESAQQSEAAPENAEETAQGDASSFKHYEPGQLAYHTDRMDVTIEQKQKGSFTYFVCDIRLTDASQLRTAFAGDDFRSGIYESVSDIASRYSPVIAINADFCRYHRNGVIIRNGSLLRKQNITKHHLMIVDQNGDMSALTDRSGKQGLVAEKLAAANTWQTFEFGPVLVENGQAATLPNNFYVNCHDGYLEPRTGIGQLGPLHYIVIVVDGRRTGYSVGCSIPQLQELFLEEGAQFAFNLDGGGSTTLYFLGDVINMPSGGKERSVSDVIMFMPNPVVSAE